MEAILVLRNYINSPSELLRHRALKSEKKMQFWEVYLDTPLIAMMIVILMVYFDTLGLAMTQSSIF